VKHGFRKILNNATVNFTGISFFSNDTGYAVSSEGFMYRTINSGGVIGIINNALPEKFELKQNYPNPFNPVTQIEYSLLKSGVINLSVYDITGKFIRTLVKEYQEFGTYKISFDASGMASGIYFYKLETNGYSEMRKLLLIK
jgi:hypothetical protein